MISAPDLIETFPFPFVADTYRYSTNVEPAGSSVHTPAGRWGERVVDVDSEYEIEIAERAEILASDPTRYAVLPHMRPACWDTMLTLMRELASAYPDTMSWSEAAPAGGGATTASASHRISWSATIPRCPRSHWPISPARFRRTSCCSISARATCSVTQAS